MRKYFKNPNWIVISVIVVLWGYGASTYTKANEYIDFINKYWYLIIIVPLLILAVSYSYIHSKLNPKKNEFIDFINIIWLLFVVGLFVVSFIGHLFGVIIDFTFHYIGTEYGILFMVIITIIARIALRNKEKV